MKKLYWVTPDLDGFYVVADNEIEAENAGYGAMADEMPGFDAIEVDDSHLERLASGGFEDYVPWGDKFDEKNPDLSLQDIARQLREENVKIDAREADRRANLKLFEGCDPRPIPEENL